MTLTLIRALMSGQMSVSGTPLLFTKTSFFDLCIILYLESYHAFRNGHSAMNQIQSYMQQTPGHVNTIVKTLKSKVSNRLAVRVFIQSTSNPERIGKLCLQKALEVNNSLTSVMNLLEEVIEITLLTQSLSEERKHNLEITLSITRNSLENTIRMEKERYEQVRKIVEKSTRRVFKNGQSDSNWIENNWSRSRTNS